MENEMDDSLYQSMSVQKKSLKKIRHRKRKYVNLTIILLIIHCIFFVVQKCSNYIFNYNNNSEFIFDSKTFRNIILIAEDIFITIYLIILLCKFLNDTFIFLFCLLYFVLGIIMLIYLFIYIMKKIRDNQEKEIIVIACYSINILLFIIESVLLFICSEIVEKEKKRKKRENLGYKKNRKPLIGEDIINYSKK